MILLLASWFQILASSGLLLWTPVVDCHRLVLASLCLCPSRLLLLILLTLAVLVPVLVLVLMP